jgi:hypothetical protein
LLLDENGLGNHRTDAARTHESGERSDNMDEKDDEISHLSILARTTSSQELWVNQQFAIDMDEKDDEIAHLSILPRTVIPRELWVNQQFAIDRPAMAAAMLIEPLPCLGLCQRHCPMVLRVSITSSWRISIE